MDAAAAAGHFPAEMDRKLSTYHLFLARLKVMAPNVKS